MTAGRLQPVTVVSQDGGTTWGRKRTVADFGFWTSVSCATVGHCWAAGSGDGNIALEGTANGGRSWAAPVTSTELSSVSGSVSCLSVQVSVAIADNGLWVTTDDGGIGKTAGSS